MYEGHSSIQFYDWQCFSIESKKKKERTKTVSKTNFIRDGNTKTKESRKRLKNIQNSVLIMANKLI